MERESLKGVSKKEIKQKDFKLPCIVPIVAYNGVSKWNVPIRFKEKISRYELFGNKILDFEYILLDVNRYEKELLVQKESISSAIFLLDQKVGYEEYMSRLITIVKEFDNLTETEKLEIKNWLKNTLGEEIKDTAIEILSSNKEEVERMTANITKTMEELKKEVRQEGIKEGIKEGQSKRDKEIVKNMLSLGMSIDNISQITGLTSDKIKEIEIND